MITANDFDALVNTLGEQAQQDIQWCESVKEPTDADQFAQEAIFVICNSGMKNTVARSIFSKCIKVLHEGTPVFDVFKHPGKASAIETIWRDRSGLLAGYTAAADKLEFCESLPWIGGITKYHLSV